MLPRMTWAFSRLLIISVFTFIGLGIAGFLLRVGGLATEYAAPHHPFLELKNPIVALGGDEGFAPSNSMPALTHALELGPTIVLGLDINRTLDGEWVVYRDDRLETLTEGSGFVELKNWADIKDLTLGKQLWNGQKLTILRLADVLKAFPDRILFLNILVRYPDRMTELIRILDPENSAPLRFVIQSPFATALREIRKSRPLWLFGIDPSSIVRFMVMNSLFLETVTDLKADLFIAPLEMQNEPVFSERVVQELARRKKAILVEDLDGQSQIAPELKPSVFGVVTRRPQKP